MAFKIILKIVCLPKRLKNTFFWHSFINKTKTIYRRKIVVCSLDNVNKNFCRVIYCWPLKNIIIKVPLDMTTV